MKARDAAGFTLLEVLVALAVFGFLLLGLSQTVRFGLTAWHQDSRLSASKTDLEAVDRTLRSIVENLSPGDDTGVPPIEGASATLSGITRLRSPGTGSAAERVDAVVGTSGSRLVLRWRPYRHRTPFGPPLPPTETELIGGVSRLVIAYWSPAGTWVSQWRDPDLPLLIRFHLVFGGEHPPHWPDIIVAPLLTRP